MTQENITNQEQVYKVEVEVFASSVEEAAWNAQMLWTIGDSLPYVTVIAPDGTQQTFDMNKLGEPGG